MPNFVQTDVNYAAEYSRALAEARAGFLVRRAWLGSRPLGGICGIPQRVHLLQ